MKIGINVAFLRKRGAGIGEVTYHFLTELVRQVADGMVADDLHFVLYAEEDFVLDALETAAPEVQARFEKRVFLPPYRRDDLVRKVWWERYSLPRRVRTDGCDVFLSLYQCPTVLQGVRHVMVAHDIIPRMFPQYMDNLRKRLYQLLSERAIMRADKVVAVSRQTEKDVIRELGIVPERVVTRYIDCDPLFKHHTAHGHVHNHDAVLKKYGIAAGYIYFGGGMDLRKNTERLLRAYKQLRRWHRDGAMSEPVPPLVISGKLLPHLAPLVTDVEALTKELNLTQHVHVLGFVPQEDLPALYASAEMFVYPSLYEGFGLPVLEAMSMGAPVVASKASSVPEVGGDSVIYCNPYSVDDIARSMRRVLLDRRIRKTLRARGPARAEHFSWEAFVRSVVRSVGE